jgi:hypothetical protein
LSQAAVSGEAVLSEAGEASPNPPGAVVMQRAMASLHRELRAVLISEEAAVIGRAVAQIANGDGWLETRSSAVLTDALCSWLGRETAATAAFFDDGIGPVEVLARVGGYFVTAREILNAQDMTITCCERHKVRFSQAKLDDYSLATNSSRFSWGTPLAQKASTRLAEILREGIDPEVARVVLSAP